MEIACEGDCVCLRVLGCEFLDKKLKLSVGGTRMAVTSWGIFVEAVSLFGLCLFLNSRAFWVERTQELRARVQCLRDWASEVTHWRRETVSE